MRALPASAALAAALLALAGATHRAQAQDLTNTGTQLTLGPGVVLTLPGSLHNQAGATLTTGGTLLLGGSLTNAGTVVPASGQVVFAGRADQTLTSGGATLANLEVRNTGPAGQNRVLLPADLTVTQQVTLTSGLLRTATTATLRLPARATLAGEASGRYVQGNLQVERTAVAGNQPVDFGHGLTLNPSGNTLGTVRATRSAGLQALDVSYGQNPASPGQRSIDRTWLVETDQPAATPVSLTLAWLPDDDNGLTFGSAQVYRVPGAGAAWEVVGSPGSGTARSLPVSATRLGRLTVGSPASSGPLPVELLAFTAERQGPDALLRWATASEKNSARFEVESSADGRSFRRLGAVASQGNSTQRHDYRFADPDLARYAAAVVYYRLRQVDQDGTAAYSPVRSLAVPVAGGFAVQSYPQPFTTTLSLLLRTDEAGPVSVELLDAVGRALLTRRATLLPGSTTLPLPEAAALPPGVYVLSVRHNRYYRIVKVVRE